MVVYYHEVECHDQKLVHNLRLGLVVQHQKSECAVEKLDYCVHRQGHSEVSKC